METQLIDPDVKQFVENVNKGKYNNLLKLYYYYKGFCVTDTANFAQRVIVEFMENYCIEIKNKVQSKNETNDYVSHSQHIRPTIHPQNKHRLGIKSSSSSNVTLMSENRKHKFRQNSQLNCSNEHSARRNIMALDNETEGAFGDEWDIDFDTDFEGPSSSRPPSSVCEEHYACNTGLSKLPTVFQTHLYFRNRKYYSNLLSDPFISCYSVVYFLYRFLEILHTRTTQKWKTNPWNFTLHSIVRELNCAVIDLLFKYDFANDKHTLERTIFNKKIERILYDMKMHELYLTVFTADYSCTAGWGDNDTIGGAHTVACGIIKQKNNVFVFILDPNGVQVERSSWWKTYTEKIEQMKQGQVRGNTKFQKVAHFFNQEMLRVLIEKINHKYSHYRCTYDPKINLNPHDLNIGGSEYQQDGYCVLISFFFIHILYNNIAIHNREDFDAVKDYSLIVQYIEDLMLFIYTLVNTDPFTHKHFLYNYSINIFRFMLSKNIEQFYEVHDLVKTKDIVNTKFSNNAALKDLFLPVTSGNVMSIYMKSIFEGVMCLPSLIGVPKLNNKSNYKDMLKNKDYSCIRFYTPYRNRLRHSEQPLRLFFDKDKEQVEFSNNSIFIVDKSVNDKIDYTECMIYEPSVVLLNLAKITHNLRLASKYKELIKDFSIMSPVAVRFARKLCLKINNPHEHITNDNTDVIHITNMENEQNVKSVQSNNPNTNSTKSRCIIS